MEIKTYNAIYSLQRFFEERVSLRLDWVHDGYEFPKDKPYMTVEIMPDERRILSKGREAVEVIEHLQLGYHASNIVDLTKMSERIADLLTFNRVPYFDTDLTVDEAVGSFLCEVTSVVPIMADDINRESEYNRVYFDVEITKIKRGC